MAGDLNVFTVNYKHFKLDFDDRRTLKIKKKFFYALKIGLGYEIIFFKFNLFKYLNKWGFKLFYVK